jgi:hypothetical protein
MPYATWAIWKNDIKNISNLFTELIIRYIQSNCVKSPRLTSLKMSRSVPAAGPKAAGNRVRSGSISS